MPLVLTIVVGMIGCTQRATDVPAQSPTPQTGTSIAFHYELVKGGGALSPATLHGRASVITFVTTYDLASQAQARFLSGVLRRRVPRINAAAVILEPAGNAPLVLAFSDALQLPYPVAWADAETIAGRGPFGDVHAVPTTIVLDRQGRLAWKRVGLAKEEELTAALDGL